MAKLEIQFEPNAEQHIRQNGGSVLLVATHDSHLG